MDTAILTNIRILTTNCKEVSQTACYADMTLSSSPNNPIKVEITHPNKENWIAHCHKSNKSYDLNIEGRNSILDLQNGNEVEIFCSASPQATL
ncbi:MAG: hypothetical protein IKD24_03075 [Alistipes sp.]|nr:hypothetical protein [Alistipes sp.]